MYQLQLFFGGPNNSLVGLTMTHNNNCDGNTFSYKPGASQIVAGKVFRDSDKMFSHNYPTAKNEFFFGFKTTEDNSSQDIIRDITIINYNSNTLFAALYKNTVWSDGKSQALFDNGRKYAAALQLLTNDVVMQAKMPTSFADVEGVYRPEHFRADKAEMEALVEQWEAQLNQETSDMNRYVEDEEEMTTGEKVVKELVKDTQTAAQIDLAWSIHIKEDEPANAGAVVAIVFGFVMFFLLLGYCIWSSCRAKRANEMSTAHGGTRVMVNTANRSDMMGTPQAKLDDIM